ncbi:FAD-dependent monooxygenase cctM [Fulvia fulva]|uniref:FAD-dependent monooxygenase cctM n=1 Tax=Passalora fulva TaxID=5499 RepID=A0A9Q8UTC6_PASFU|nr:FAD-dependent monooxygenase cctM [Fulvia fulva]KAK4613996.1 FAD-dependent monooxygenase cctM [Fulvia fulva]KAK4615061.1 FAD-dependent monooxygenase cctM [Fulvia fulva]UJO21640.1 FAD-dependent monooxygenase cctM [Fulvia fulva]WPV20692.1 FAD-dependent monooxygenase cctM [Fulvia fulva]WPV35522.1 FAD-dependent monooxygenase cctM [Fulvia fulva]
MAAAARTGHGPRVLVIGSGSAGLLTAQALHMQGARVTVFEQDSSLDARPRDWNFGIYWAQDPLAECLPEHIQKEVENAQVDGHRAGEDEVMPIYNGESGELLKNVPIPYNIRLARKKFLKLISTGIDIQYGKRLVDISSDGKQATATFEDGTTETGNLLIGAEGAHSPVRKFLVGPEKAAVTHLPLVASVTVAKLPAEAALKFQAFARRLMVIFHPLGYFNWIGLHDAPERSQPGEWTFMMIMSWIPEDREYDVMNVQNDAILADLKRRAKDFSDDIRLLWESVPEGTKCWHNRLSYWIPEPWHNRNGTVTLVGDAAHPMTFHRGQGLNNAIHDVALLARQLKEHGSTTEALNSYEQEMIPRARDAVIGSTDNSLATHDWSKLVQSPLFTKGLSQM